MKIVPRTKNSFLMRNLISFNEDFVKSIFKITSIQFLINLKSFILSKKEPA